MGSCVLTKGKRQGVSVVHVHSGRGSSADRGAPVRGAGRVRGGDRHTLGGMLLKKKNMCFGGHGGRALLPCYFTMLFKVSVECGDVLPCPLASLKLGAIEAEGGCDKLHEVWTVEERELKLQPGATCYTAKDNISFHN